MRSSKVHAATGFTLTRPLRSSQVTSGVFVRGGRLVAADAGEPHLVAAERFLQGLDLAAGAAQRGIAVVQLRAELGILFGDRLLGQHVDDAHVEGAVDLVAREAGLGEVVAGVEEEHVDVRQLVGDEVRQRGIRHRAGDGGGLGREDAARPRR